MRTGYGGKVMRLFASALLICFVLSVTAMAAPTIRKTEYEGKGKVDVSFGSKVSYNDVKVTVKNADGKSETCTIVNKDADDLEFRIKNYKAGSTYRYTISGVAVKGEKDYGSVSGKVSIPKAKGGIPLKEIEYDAKDKEVTFDFDTRVEWKSPKVKIRKNGKNYVKKIRAKDADDIEVSVKKLKKGKKYKYTISGIRKKGSGDYTSISGTFTP